MMKFLYLLFLSEVPLVAGSQETSSWLRNLKKSKKSEKGGNCVASHRCNGYLDDCNNPRKDEQGCHTGVRKASEHILVWGVVTSLLGLATFLAGYPLKALMDKWIGATGASIETTVKGYVTTLFPDLKAAGVDLGTMATDKIEELMDTIFAFVPGLGLVLKGRKVLAYLGMALTTAGTTLLIIPTLMLILFPTNNGLVVPPAGSLWWRRTRSTSAIPDFIPAERVVKTVLLYTALTTSVAGLVTMFLGLKFGYTTLFAGFVTTAVGNALFWLTYIIMILGSARVGEHMFTQRFNVVGSFVSAALVLSFPSNTSTTMQRNFGVMRLMGAGGVMKNTDAFMYRLLFAAGSCIPDMVVLGQKGTKDNWVNMVMDLVIKIMTRLGFGLQTLLQRGMIAYGGKESTNNPLFQSFSNSLADQNFSSISAKLGEMFA